MTPLLTARKISKAYGEGHARTEVLKDVDFELQEGEFVAIVGFSGSGKTTLMQLLTGLIRPDTGVLRLRGEEYTGTTSDIGLVFQNYSLLPWLTVYGNIALAVNQGFPQWSKQQRHEHVMRHIEMVSLSHAVGRRPHELSGGMRQRVSLARTLSMQPRVLLLDEPLSALDALTRSVLQGEILRIWEQAKTTCVLITNDVDEALLMADRIVALTPGPAATLAREFAVDLPRPRDRTELNHDATFKALRNDVTRYLIGLRDRARSLAETKRSVAVALPPLKPIDLHRPIATASISP